MISGDIRQFIQRYGSGPCPAACKRMGRPALRSVKRGIGEVDEDAATAIF